jgi:hypothetical protein
MIRRSIQAEQSMTYKNRGAKVRVELIKNGTEVLVSANPEGLRYLADICAGLADDPRAPPHIYVEPALNSAEPDSVPIEFLVKPDL